MNSPNRQDIVPANLLRKASGLRIIRPQGMQAGHLTPFFQGVAEEFLHHPGLSS
jgi:hypothetical protein